MEMWRSALHKMEPTKNKLKAFNRSVWGKVKGETPKYTVIKEHPMYEVRRYPPQVAATVSSEGLLAAQNSNER